ncbi:MAG: hypothetical protein ACFFCP_01120 [Promethearchaeota archaeon]
MSEVVECPYCGSSVQTQTVVDYDDKIRLRCPKCGGQFEYLPGFGAFSLPKEDQRGSYQYSGPSDYQEPGGYESQYEAPWRVERARTQGGDQSKCLAIFCCLCVVVPAFLWITIFFSFLFSIP